MSEKFLSSLQQINARDPKTSLESILGIFTSINALDEQGVIAAYQTFRFFLENREKQDEITEKRIRRIEEALQTRMERLCSLAPKNGRRALALVFSRAGNETMIMVKLRNVIDCP